MQLNLTVFEKKFQYAATSLFIIYECEFYDHSSMCPPDYSEDFKEFALTITNEHHLPEPHDGSSALDLYTRLLGEVEKLT